MLIDRFSRAENSAIGQKLYGIAVAFLLILSEVFSSNIQSTLPSLSTACRVFFTGGALLLLLIKLVFFTDFDARWQLGCVAAAVGCAGFFALYGHEIWVLLAVLAGVAAKGCDLRRVLTLYLAVAVSGLLLVQLLHYTTNLVPFNFYCRGWDYGYGHYNGYGARLFGVFMAWAWLRSKKMRWFDWLGLAALFLYTLFVPGCRGAGLSMLALLLLFVLQRLLPKFFCSKAFYALTLCCYPLLCLLSLWAGYVFDPERPGLTPVLAKINRLLSGRFEVWHHVFWHNSLTHPAEDGAAAWLHLSDTMPNVITALGGFETDGDAHHAIDNAFLALIMNKGVLGAIVISVCVLLLTYRLCRRKCTAELLCLLALFAYLMMENKPFLISANPLFLLLPVLLVPRGTPLPRLPSQIDS